MITRLWKALATIAVLALLFWPALRDSLPQILWVVLLILTLTYGISLLLSTHVSAPRRFGIAYLAFVGLTYLLAGIAGFSPNGGLIESSMWYSLISPYPLITLLGHSVLHSSHAIKWSEIYVYPLYEHHLFSAMVVVVSCMAIVAAFAMAQRNRMACKVWLALVAFSVLATLGYVVAGFARWGATETILPSCWVTSYLVAYALARNSVDLKAHHRAASSIYTPPQKG
jgi:hypothetical protein